MSYRKEMEELIIDLHQMANEAIHSDLVEKRRRQAEVLDFLVHHLIPSSEGASDALANLKSQED